MYKVYIVEVYRVETLLIGDINKLRLIIYREKLLYL